MNRLLFSYEQKNSFFHVCDPISKVIWLVSFSVLSLLIDSALPQLFLLLFVFILAVFFAKIKPSEMGFIVTFFIVFAFCWFIIQSTLIGGNKIFLQLGPIRLTFEGMNKAGAVALRSVVLIGLARVFIGTTEPRTLALDLVQRWKLPYTVGFSIFFMMRLLPLFEQEYSDLQDARRIRGADIRKGLLGIPTLLFDYTKSLLLRAFRRSVITSYSLDSRAFRARPNRTYLTRIYPSIEGKILIVMSLIVFIIGCIYLFV